MSDIEVNQAFDMEMAKAVFPDNLVDAFDDFIIVDADQIVTIERANSPDKTDPKPGFCIRALNGKLGSDDYWEETFKDALIVAAGAAARYKASRVLWNLERQRKQVILDQG